MLYTVRELADAIAVVDRTLRDWLRPVRRIFMIRRVTSGSRGQHSLTGL